MHSKGLFRSLNIKWRLILGFIGMSIILCFAVGLTIKKIQNTKLITEDIIQIQFPLYDELVAVHKEIYLAQASIRGWLLTHDDRLKSEFNHSWSNIEASKVTIDNLMKKTSNQANLNDWQAMKMLLTRLRETQSLQYVLTTREAIQHLNDKNIPTANKIMDLMDGPMMANGQRKGGLFNRQDEQFHLGTKVILDDMRSLEWTEYSLLVVGILISVLLSITTLHSILDYISGFRKYTSKVASGDLTDRLHVTSQDEMGLLAHDLNQMTDSLVLIVKEIIEANNGMLATIEEARNVAATQSSSAIEHASSVNEITVSIKEIKKISTQTLEKAKTLASIAEKTREQGLQGLDAVDQSVQSMKNVREKVQTIAQTILELSNKTQQIGEITSVVNHLARQSKMLALNASIEAAKAGEAGKGFAVVATEVKNLAEQSEESTTQVQKILEDIRNATEKAVMVTEEGTKEVDAGTKLTEQAGEIMGNLTEVIHETTLASKQIEASVNQESTGIEQITAGMNEMNQVTSVFVKSAQQTTQSIEHLTQITNSLKKQINAFKT